MNEVFKNTHVFVDVLSMSRCDLIQEWDEGAFEKAYKWANYFEEVYHKLKSRPSLAEKVDKYLDNFNNSGKVYFGNVRLSFEFLGKSKMLLRQFLVQNPHLSDKQYRIVLQLYGVKIGELQDCSNMSQFLNDVSSLSQTKSTVRLLSRMRDHLTDNMKHMSGPSSIGNISVTDSLLSVEEFPCARDSEGISMAAIAHCLFNYIQHHLRLADPKHRKLLHDKLGILAVQENGLDTIISCLLLIPEDCASVLQVETVTQFVLEWLLGFLSQTKPHPQLMSVPPMLLSRAAFVWLSFFELYLCHLVSWAEGMVPSVCSAGDNCHSSTGLISWRYKCVQSGNAGGDEANQNLTFMKLISHFRYLVNGPAFMADIAKKTIHSHCAQRHSSQNSSLYHGNSLPLNYIIWWDICTLLNIGT